MELLSKSKVILTTGVLSDVFPHYMAGKHHRTFFCPKYSRRKWVLELVHTDICSIGEKSLGGARYFVSFIDDQSIKVWAFAIKTKDHVANVFQARHAAFERETRRKLKTIRSDNGGEYRGPFEAYYKPQGICMEKTMLKSPQQNGIAEHMNRSLLERVRSMLSHSHLPKSFWGEAL